MDYSYSKLNLLIPVALRSIICSTRLVSKICGLLDDDSLRAARSTAAHRLGPDQAATWAVPSEACSAGGLDGVSAQPTYRIPGTAGTRWG
jgi:hypothetical protein